jgi:hypothetical protein
VQAAGAAINRRPPTFTCPSRVTLLLGNQFRFRLQYRLQIQQEEEEEEVQIQENEPVLLSRTLLLRAYGGPGKTPSFRHRRRSQDRPPRT